MKIAKLVKIGVIILVAAAVVTLGTLRVTGFEPADVDPQVVIDHGLHYFVRPGLWLRGAVVTTPVTDWSFIRQTRTSMLQTRSPYFLPHSVRVAPLVRNGQLYIGSGQVDFDPPFPADKRWTANVARDPRVRLKVADKIYELTLALVTNRAEAETLLGRSQEFWSKGADGQPHLVRYQHIYRAFQRNITEYGTGLTAAR